MYSDYALRRVDNVCRHLQPTACHGNHGGRAPLFAGQVAIVTGSGQGIGASAAKIFAREGAKVVVSDLDEKKAEAIVAEIKAVGGQAIAICGNVMHKDFPEKLIEGTVTAFGKINIVVNNAGFCWDGMIHKMTDEQWNTIMDCHTGAPFRILRAAAKYMRVKDNEPRCVVNVSSTSGLHGNSGQANYSTAKLGIVGLTKTLAKEWGPFGVRVNAVAFGMIATRLTATKGTADINIDGKKIAQGVPEGMMEMGKMLIPLGREGQPDEAAGGIIALCSPYASYITGHCLEVTGGMGI